MIIVARNSDYYTIDHILNNNIKAQYYIIFGMRSNGKSYSVKHFCLEQFAETGSQFIYLRRWETETRKSKVEQYFADVNVKKIFGRNGYIDCVSGKIMLHLMNEDEGYDKPVIVGYACNLATQAHYTGMSYPNVQDVIFEEFISRDSYIENEPSILMDFISTVARDRDIRVWCIGNTLTRFTPYFTEWNMRKALQLAGGESLMYHFDTNRYDDDNSKIYTDIYVEHARQVASKSKMFFGKKSDMITAGEWDTLEMPHLPKTETEYIEEYKFFTCAQGFQHTCRVLTDPETGVSFIYVTPKTTNVKSTERLVTDRFSVLPLHTTGFVALSEGEKRIFNLFREGRVCYSDNLTGTDFKQAYQVLKRV